MTTWNKQASNLLKSELTRRGISYGELQEKLAAIDVKETPNSIAVKINRGAFSFAFALQVLKSIDAKVLRLGEE